VAYIGGANESFAFHFKYFGDFFASQAALLSPLVFILITAAWFFAMSKKQRNKNWIFSFLLFTSFPMFAFFLLLSLHTRVYGNWPGAAYLAGSILVAAFFSGKSSHIYLNKKPGVCRRLFP